MDRGVKRVIKGCIRLNSFKTVMLLTLMVCFSLLGASKALASDNVLQAIQIDGVKDSYKIVLRSDDSAEIKKTIQAPNKMIIDLKGIRASKSINTIYNNTASVDSVVVEPISADSVKILIQADNVGNAEVHFDTLKTPLGVLNKTEAQKNADQLVLNKPMESYTPVYEDDIEDAEGFPTSNILAGPTGKAFIQILKSEKVSWTVAFGMLAIMLLSGIKGIKGKDSQIRVGLSQSLKERELDLYREIGMNNPVMSAPLSARASGLSNLKAPSKPASGINYGLKAYQNGTKNPYVSSEIQRPRPMTAPKQTYSATQATANKSSVGLGLGVQNTIQNTTQKSVNPALKQAQAPGASKTTSIDSMKFLESMTKIYEKNGRTDLAQGLKQNMKKAKMNAI